MTYCTGGTIAEIGDKRIHTFTSNGTLNVIIAGNLDYLVVAGGGGGGASVDGLGGSGGGGAGGMRTGTLAVTVGNKTVTVGAGGPGGGSAGVQGTAGYDSVLDTITSAGGGYGGGQNGSTGDGAGGAGGSGGGGGSDHGHGDPAGGAGTGGQGYAGGAGGQTQDYYSGGGGGAGEAGNTDGSREGGDGTASSISGSSVTYAGGGGGAFSGGGGTGGGGAGGDGIGGAAGDGTPNTGGGGGGHYGQAGGVPGGAGGSGIVIVSYDWVAPTVTSIDPDSGSTAGGTDVDINGSDFVTGATVTFGVDAATDVVFVSSIKLTCKTPAHTGGLVDVIVTNPDTQIGTLVNGYEYIAPPVITAIVPASGSTKGGDIVEIQGNDFVNGATVTFGGESGIGVIYDAMTGFLACAAPAHDKGLVDVVVTNPDTQYDTLVNGFEYESGRIWAKMLMGVG